MNNNKLKHNNLKHCNLSNKYKKNTFYIKKINKICDFCMTPPVIEPEII